MWTKKELLEYVEGRAKEYAKMALVSVKQNKHMNELDGTENIEQKVVDAILTDFVNYIGLHQGLDYGMYTYDLYRSRKVKDLH